MVTQFWLGRIPIRKGPGIDRHDRRRPLITRKLPWRSILRGWPSRAESAQSGSHHQHPERPAHLGRGALLREILWVRPFLWMNWSMHLFTGPCSPYWRSHRLWQAHSPSGSGTPGSHVLAIAQILVERTRRRAVSPGDMMESTMLSESKSQKRAATCLIPF